MLEHWVQRAWREKRKSSSARFRLQVRRRCRERERERERAEEETEPVDTCAAFSLGQALRLNHSVKHGQGRAQVLTCISLQAKSVGADMPTVCANETKSEKLSESAGERRLKTAPHLHAAAQWMLCVAVAAEETSARHGHPTRRKARDEKERGSLQRASFLSLFLSSSTTQPLLRGTDTRHGAQRVRRAPPPRSGPGLGCCRLWRRGPAGLGGAGGGAAAGAAAGPQAPPVGPPQRCAGHGEKERACGRLHASISSHTHAHTRTHTLRRAHTDTDTDTKKESG